MAGELSYFSIGVEDLDSAVARVRRLGGSIEGHAGEEGEDETSVERFGRFRLCRDDQGSAFGLHQPPAEH